MTAELLAKFDELIAATRAATVAPEWGDAETIGRLLAREPRYVLERLACRPDFPKPFPDGQPRWLIEEVREWALEYRRSYLRTGKRRAA